MGRVIHDEYPQKGFTLIEVLAVLSIVGFMVGVAVVPAYQQWLSHMRLETKARQLLNDLQWTRNQAMRTHQTVMLCKSDNKTHCGGHWENGWLIASTAREANPLRYHQGAGDHYTIIWRGARKMEHVQFNANGSSAGYNGRFVLCHRLTHRRPIAWVIYISQTGRIRLAPSRDISQCDMH